MKKVRWRLASITALICAGVVYISLQSVERIVAEDQAKTSNSDSADEGGSDESSQSGEKGRGKEAKNKKAQKDLAPKKKATKPASQSGGARGGAGQGVNSGGRPTSAGGAGRPIGSRATDSNSSGVRNDSDRPALSQDGSVQSSGTNDGRAGGNAGAAAPGNEEYPKEVQNAIKVQEKHSANLMSQKGVVGTAISQDEAGKIYIKVSTSGVGNPTIPATIDGIPVKSVLTGVKRPLNGAAGQSKYDPRVRQKRPVPIGTSSLNGQDPACDGSICFYGTLGCRLKAKDGSGYYALSNSHVFSDEGNAALDTNIVQPGPGDVNCQCIPEDIIGKLFAFKAFNYGSFNNVMDAAIISTTSALVSNRTLPDGYGVPRTYTIKRAQLGMRVQKYGRTTGYTKGRVTGINAIAIVPYTNGLVFFHDQIEVTGDRGSIFGDHGDSGSLIVTEDRFPIALLFAGDEITHVISGNPIQPVLDEFGMEIDGDDSLDFPVPGKSGRAQPDVP